MTHAAQNAPSIHPSSSCMTWWWTNRYLWATFSRWFGIGRVFPTGCQDGDKWRRTSLCRDTRRTVAADTKTSSPVPGCFLAEAKYKPCENGHIWGGGGRLYFKTSILFSLQTKMVAAHEGCLNLINDLSVVFLGHGFCQIHCILNVIDTCQVPKSILVLKGKCSVLSTLQSCSFPFATGIVWFLQEMIFSTNQSNES